MKRDGWLPLRAIICYLKASRVCIDVWTVDGMKMEISTGPLHVQTRPRNDRNTQCAFFFINRLLYRIKLKKCNKNGPEWLILLSCSVKLSASQPLEICASSVIGSWLVFQNFEDHIWYNEELASFFIVRKKCHTAADIALHWNVS